MSLKDLKNSIKLTDLSVSQVKELQQLLVQANYDIAVDGILGSQTKHAFKSFKEARRLTLPDMIGTTTLKHLIKSPKINSEGLTLIKEFEGFYPNAYLCPSFVVTIGYGTTYYKDRSKVKLGDRITKEEAEELLLWSLTEFEEAISKLVTVPLTSNQFSALVSFVYNVGIGAFKESTLRKRLNQKEYLKASDEFERWVHGGGQILPGLVRRRKAEKTLFLKT